MSDSLKKQAIRSWLLICPKQPEGIAHICSFVLSNFSEWANSQPCKNVTVWVSALG